MNSTSAAWGPHRTGLRGAARRRGDAAGFADHSPANHNPANHDFAAHNPGEHDPAAHNPGEHDRPPRDDRGHGRRGRRHGPRGLDRQALGAGLGPDLPRPDREHRGRRRGRRPRGDIRLAVLALLAEQPRHGYEIIQEVAQRTDDSWRPSPGSVYPILQQLEDEGLVRTSETEGRRMVALTEDGARYVDEHVAGLASVWTTHTDEVTAPVGELRNQYALLHAAVLQIMNAGTDPQREAAAAALADARKAIYRLLAE